MDSVGPVELKHSGLGIASFAISAVFGTFSLVIIPDITEILNGMGPSLDAIVLALAAMMSVIMDFVALGLGLGGIFQKNRQKIFAILGTICSSMIIMFVIYLFVIGTNSR
ncbi:MAG: hypothetical protein WC975_05085 [Phycisphaerae bacterium]